VKPSFDLAKLQIADIDAMDMEEKLSQLGISLYIFLQICIAVMALKVSQTKFWEAGLEDRVHFVRRDIKREERSDKNASNDRLQWWIDGIVGDHSEWLEDGYLLGGEAAGKEGKLEV
jgi:hypothetical protein